MEALKEMREELEKQIRRIAEVEEIKKQLDAEMGKWKCTRIEKKKEDRWEITYSLTYDLCGKKITETKLFPISFM